MPSRSTKFLVCIFAFSLWAFDAKAYIDPGTGSAVLQAIVAAILAAGLMIQVFWQRVKAFFANLFSRPTKSDESGGD